MLHEAEVVGQGIEGQKHRIWHGWIFTSQGRYKSQKEGFQPAGGVSEEEVTGLS